MQFQFPVFENLCPSWASVTHLGRQRKFKKGRIIIHSASPVYGVYLVVEGIVEVALYTPNGPEKALYHVGPGSVFGDVACFSTGESGEGNVRARTDCTTLFFSLETIKGTIAQKHPHLLIELLQSSAVKIRMYGVYLQDSLSYNNFLRVCKMLVYLVRFKMKKVDPSQTHVTLHPGMTQNDIARLLGIHRVTVTKAINRLKEMGIIKRFTKSILDISDYHRLHQLSERDEMFL